MREEGNNSEEMEMVSEIDSEKVEKQLKRLKTSLKECEKERKEYLSGWQREKANAQNQKKIQLQRLQEEQSRALASYVEKILPVLDSILAARNQSKESSSGLDQVYKQCVRSFEDLGVTILEPVGEIFNPVEHEAIGRKEVTEKNMNEVVVEVARVGARFDSILIRAAMVYVGEYKK